MKDISRINIRVVGPRPPFYQVAEYLWGRHVDIDSDGNSVTPNDPNWTELTIICRSDNDARVDIDLIDKESSILIIKSESRECAEKVRDFLIQFGAAENVS